MEVDFTGKTFELIDKLTGEIMTIVVFVAVLPYSQYIYAEGMVSTANPSGSRSTTMRWTILVVFRPLLYAITASRPLLPTKIGLILI